MPSRRGCLWTGRNTSMGREGPADPVGVCQEEGGQRTGAENPWGQAAGSGDSKSLAGAEPPRAALGQHTFLFRCRAMEDMVTVTVLQPLSHDLNPSRMHARLSIPSSGRSLGVRHLLTCFP